MGCPYGVRRVGSKREKRGRHYKFKRERNKWLLEPRQNLNLKWNSP